jgi:hypothetical protein
MRKERPLMNPVPTVGGVQITFEYFRHVGPRYIHGGVTLSLDAQLPYSFSSEASWPTGDNYEEAIREAIEEVLRERLGGLTRTQVVLKRITWDTVSSCQLGFARAARAATSAAFEV